MIIRKGRLGDAVLVKQKAGAKITERGATIQKILPPEPAKDGQPAKPERYLLKFEARHWSEPQEEREVPSDDPSVSHRYPEHAPRPFVPPKIPGGGG